jgi:hypothetical protein
MRACTGRSFNGRTRRSGRRYRGSNPCLPANSLAHARSLPGRQVFRLGAIGLRLIATGTESWSAGPPGDAMRLLTHTSRSIHSLGSLIAWSAGLPVGRDSPFAASPISTGSRPAGAALLSTDVFSRRGIRRLYGPMEQPSRPTSGAACRGGRWRLGARRRIRDRITSCGCRCGCAFLPNRRHRSVGALRCRCTCPSSITTNTVRGRRRPATSIRRWELRPDALAADPEFHTRSRAGVERNGSRNAAGRNCRCCGVGLRGGDGDVTSLLG